MSFDEDGFLSEDIEKWRTEKRVKYPEHFKMLTEINQTAQGMLALTGKLPRRFDLILVCGFYVRALQSFQGSILMAERGLLVEAVTLMRATVETLFYLSAARKNPKFQEGFGRQHIKTLNKVVGNHIAALKRIEPRDASAADTSEDLNSVLEHMREQGVEPADLQIFRVAEMADMVETYRTNYALFSTWAHPTVLALDQIWDKPDPMAVPTGINWGPDKGEKYALPDRLLQIALSGLQLILEMNEVFQSTPVRQRIELHRALYLKLLQETEDSPLEPL